jgi:NADPH-dependent 2,4-dienoyl-CoA reductase/sulfur reductase-like enzyme
MPYYISGVTADYRGLVARTPEEFRSKNGVDVLTGHRVLEIDAAGRRVKVADLEGGRSFWSDYTRLLISTGASAFVPPVDGVNLAGCFLLRKLADSIAIRTFLEERNPSRAVIIGAGPIGMEMCESFRLAGLEVSVVEMAEEVMPLMDPDVASILRVKLEKMDVTCLPGQRLEAIEGDAGGVRGVVTSSGRIECDIVLLGIGIRPVTNIASAAGVELGVKGAIKVDRLMRTNVPDIYAAGDCATTTNTITGRQAWMPLGSTSRKQGRLVADNMFGAALEFPGVQGTSIVKCFDLTIGRTGLNETEARDAGFDPVEVSMETGSLNSYFPGGGNMRLKLLADRSGGRLLGAQVVGDLASTAEKRLDVIAVAIGARMTACDLQYLDLAYAPPYSAAVDAPIIAGNLMAGKLLGKPCSCGPEGLE